MSGVFIPLKNREIYLLESHGPSLKSALGFLKWVWARPSLSFSYVPQDGNLLDSLTLGENMALESPQFSRSRKFSSELLLNFNQSVGPGVPSLPWELLPHQAGPQATKLASLLRAFCANRPFLIFEAPEKHLSPPLLEFFMGLLAQSSQTVLIVTSQRELFEELADHWVVEKDGSYSIKSLVEDSWVGQKAS